eukprot:jgi/Bigna1/66183/fgenesh1_pg.1_\
MADDGGDAEAALALSTLLVEESGSDDIDTNDIKDEPGRASDEDSKETETQKKKEKKPKKKSKEALYAELSRNPDAFKVACISNGCKPQDARSLSKVEIFMTNYSKMRGLEPFVNCQHLEILHQPIKAIEGLERMPFLETVWICHTKIDRISGLERNSCINELHLDFNQIAKIENLDHLEHLSVLSITGNKITKIRGLKELKKLRDLNVAGNSISVIFDSLEEMEALEHLNLAGNQITSFSEIKWLKRLPNLKRLYLNDPHYGDNPICNLSNYHTYSLYHMSHLEVLDCVKLGPQAVRLAEATYQKKQINRKLTEEVHDRFYAMHLRRITSIRSDILTAGANLVRELVNKVDLLLHPVIKSMKTLVVDELRKTHGVQLGDRRMVSRELAAVQSEIGDHIDIVRALEGELYTLTHVINSAASQLSAKLKMELDTGGNFQLVHRTEREQAWFKSCVKFMSLQYKKVPGVDLRIQDVIKVENQFVRNRFEETLQALPVFNPVRIDSPKPQLHYMFLCAEPHEYNLEVVLRKGFGKVAGGRGIVTLTDSVNLALERKLGTKLSSGYNKSILRKPQLGSLLVVKVYLGNNRSISQNEVPPNLTDMCATFRDYNSISVSVDDEDAAAKQKEEEGQRDGDKDDEDRNKNAEGEQGGGKPKRKVVASQYWYVFDTALIVPEYIIEYKIGEKKVTKHSKEDDESKEVWIEKFIMSKTNDSLLSFFYFWEAGNFSEEPGIVPNSMISFEPPASDEALQLARTFSTLAKPYDEFRERLAKVKKIISRKDTKGASPRIVSSRDHEREELHISPNQIFVDAFSRKLLITPVLPNSKKLTYALLNGYKVLKTLILSFNRLNSIEELDGIALPALTFMDLAYNEIKTLKGFPSAPNLKSLDVSHNLLTGLAEIDAIAKQVPDLLEVNLRGNYFCRSLLYKTKVLSCFPKLIGFDLQKVSHRTRKRIKKLPSVPLSEKVLLQSSDLCGAQFLSRMGSASKIQTEMKEILGENGDSKWRERVTELKLGSMGYKPSSKLLTTFPNLKTLQLPNNDISDADELQLSNCKCLQALDLDGNRISRIPGSLPDSLMSLSLANNLISRMEKPSGWTASLTRLCLENNQISSLEGFSSLTALMELYLTRNKLSESKELMHLKRLPQLLILDLSQNDVVKADNYRNFVIFHLKIIKVLDGISIHTSEQIKARDMFSGKESTHTIRSLDLTDAGVKKLGIIDAKRFSNLRILNLDKNRISELIHFHPLPSLSILRLNDNRIVSIPMSKKNPDIGLLAELFPKLEVLELGHNRISSISNVRLSGLHNLKVLSLDSNDIVVVEGLNDLVKLQQIILSDNKIKRIDRKSFRGLTHLRGIQLDGNSLRSLLNIGPLPNLRTLFASFNRINDFGELDYLNSNLLPTLAKVSFKGNPLARKPGYREKVIVRIANMVILDGTVITPQDRQEAIYSTNSTNMFGQQALSQDFVESSMVTNNGGGGLHHQMHMQQAATPGILMNHGAANSGYYVRGGDNKNGRR